jgi:hypothetical protein
MRPSKLIQDFREFPRSLSNRGVDTQIARCTACLSRSRPNTDFRIFAQTQNLQSSKIQNSIKFKIQSKCSTSFLRCILQQSTCHHRHSFTSQRSFFCFFMKGPRTTVLRLFVQPQWRRWGWAVFLPIFTINGAPVEWNRQGETDNALTLLPTYHY